MNGGQVKPPHVRGNLKGARHANRQDATDDVILGRYAAPIFPDCAAHDTTKRFGNPLCASQRSFCAAIFRLAQANFHFARTLSSWRGRVFASRRVIFALRTRFSLCAGENRSGQAVFRSARGSFHFARTFLRLRQRFFGLRGQNQLCAGQLSHCARVFALCGSKISFAERFSTLRGVF